PPGNIVGSAGGGALAQVVGQHVTYAVMAALLLAGCVALSGRRAPVQQATVADGLSVGGA
ncbi:MAG TPA: hypothetical protein VGI52_10160, partial [Solirubrobacteraceae bacterium]